MQRGRERDPDDRAFWRLKPGHRLAPRFLAPLVQQGKSSLAQFLGGGLDSVRVAHLELQAHLRDGAIAGQSGVPKHASAASDSGQIAKCLLPSIRSLWK